MEQLPERGELLGECLNFSFEEMLRTFKIKIQEISPVESLFKGTVIDFGTINLWVEDALSCTKGVLQLIDHLDTAYFAKKKTRRFTSNPGVSLHG